MYNATVHPLANAQPMLQQEMDFSSQLSPHLYFEHDALWYGISLWPVKVSCPGHAPSQLLSYLLTARVWETEKSSTDSEHY